MFERLLKYPIDIFRQGDFYFGIRLPGLILFLIFVGLIAASIWAYRTTRGRTHRDSAAFSSSSAPSRSVGWHSVC